MNTSRLAIAGLLFFFESVFNVIRPEFKEFMDS